MQLCTCGAQGPILEMMFWQQLGWGRGCGFIHLQPRHNSSLQRLHPWATACAPLLPQRPIPMAARRKQPSSARLQALQRWLLTWLRPEYLQVEQAGNV